MIMKNQRDFPILSVSTDRFKHLTVRTYYTMSTHRTIVYIKSNNALAEQVLRSVTQEDSALRIPSLNGTTMSKQVKYTIPIRKIENLSIEFYNLFKIIGKFDMTYKKGSIKSESFKNELFDDWLNLFTSGVCLNVAPQNAKTFKEYKDYSIQLRDLIWKEFNKNSDDKLGYMIFYQEWWKYCKFDSELNFELKDNFFKWFDIDGETFDYKLDAWEVILNNDELSLFGYWNEIKNEDIVIEKPTNGVRGEFAILYEMATLEGEEIDSDRPLDGIRGSLVRGKESTLIPTMVFVTPQHDTVEGWTIKQRIIEPAGMHPNYEIELVASSDKEDWEFEPVKDGFNDCELNFVLDVSKEIILDKYQLEGLTSNKNSNSCFKKIKVHNGGMDLELPEYKIEEYGGSLSLLLDQDCVVTNRGFEIPLHLRYGSPNDIGGLTNVTIPKGKLYWECDMDQSLGGKVTESFYHVEGRLGIDTMKEHKFGGRYYHFEDMDRGNDSLSIPLPIGNLSEIYIVNTITVILVVTSSLFIFKRLLN